MIVTGVRDGGEPVEGLGQEVVEIGNVYGLSFI